jgi:predicted Zn finger-like uncharacterized protein
MIITCEECDTSFNLDDKVVKPSGSKVRCSQCRHVFTVHPPSALAADQAGLSPQTAAQGADVPVGAGVQAADAASAGGALGFDEELDPGAEQAFEKALQELALEEDGAASSGDMDLGEIENLLELEDGTGGPKERPAAAASQTSGAAAEGQGSGADDEELDLSGLDELFDIPEEAEANEGGDHPIAAGGGQKTALDEDETDDDDIIDLSDLEEMLDFEEDQDAEEPQEVELTLSEDFGAEEDLSAIDDGGEESDLDLSDLESLLETDEAEDGAADAASDDLQGAEAEAALDGDGDDVEMIDLSDVGGTFDDEGAAVADADDLELQLDFESAADEDLKAADDDFELEFETDQDKQGAALGAAATGAVAVGGAAVAAAAADTPVGVQAAAGKHAAMARPAEPKKVFKPEPRRAAVGAQKKGGGAPALILLLLVLLIVGLLALQKFMGVHIPYVTDLTRSIPVVGEFVQPQGQVSDPAGNLHLSTLNINSRFIENESLGRLFIITGEVKNGYSVPRRHIQVNGKIYSQGKQLVKSENVFSGNILSDLDLKNLSFEEIQGRLNAKGGTGMANQDVKPGATVPFMLVFSNLPENLEEFTIEVTGSTAATPPAAN